MRFFHHSFFCSVSLTLLCSHVTNFPQCFFDFILLFPRLVTMGSRVTHVPFPNTLVKPSSAYGSAAHCSARVGRRQAFFFSSFFIFLLTLLLLFDYYHCFTCAALACLLACFLTIFILILAYCLIADSNLAFLKIFRLPSFFSLNFLAFRSLYII